MRNEGPPGKKTRSGPFAFLPSGLTLEGDCRCKRRVFRLGGSIPHDGTEEQMKQGPKQESEGR